MYEVLVNRLGGLSLPRKSVVRLTYRPDMTLDAYRGRKTTSQQHLTHTRTRFKLWICVLCVFISNYYGSVYLDVLISNYVHVYFVVLISNCRSAYLDVLIKIMEVSVLESSGGLGRT